MWSNLSTTQKVVLAVSLPVTGVLLYMLLRKTDDDDDYQDRRKVVTSRQTVIEMQVPSTAVGAIIGSQGAKIKEIQEISGARVNFKDSGAQPKSAERTVAIRGTPDNAQKAELLIRKVIADQPVLHTEVIWVPQRAVGRIIGRGGETIRTMCRASKCKITVDRSEVRRDDNMKEITLVGSSTAIASAKGLLSEKIEEEEAFRAKTAACAANRPRRQQHNSAQEPATAAVAPFIQQGAAPTSMVIAAAGAEDEEWEHGDTSSWKPEGLQQNLEQEGWPTHTEFLEVYVSAVEHPEHFWVQVLSFKAVQLDQLMEEMTRYYASAEVSKESHVEDLAVGDIVAAPFEGDPQWYRARVLEIKEDMVDIYYVDFGDSELVARDKVRILRSNFLSLPFQAFECSLARVKPIGSDNQWSEKAIEAFELLSHTAKWKVLMAKTVYYRRDELGCIPCIELVDTSGPMDVNLGETLVNDGLAVWCEDSREESPGGAAHDDNISQITDSGFHTMDAVALEEDSIPAHDSPAVLCNPVQDSTETALQECERNTLQETFSEAEAPVSDEIKGHATCVIGVAPSLAQRDISDAVLDSSVGDVVCDMTTSERPMTDVQALRCEPVPAVDSTGAAQFSKFQSCVHPQDRKSSADATVPSESSARCQTEDVVCTSGEPVDTAVNVTESSVGCFQNVEQPGDHSGDANVTFDGMSESDQKQYIAESNQSEINQYLSESNPSCSVLGSITGHTVSKSPAICNLNSDSNTNNQEAKLVSNPTTAATSADIDSGTMCDTVHEGAPAICEANASKLNSLGETGDSLDMPDTPSAAVHLEKTQQVASPAFLCHTETCDPNGEPSEVASAAPFEPEDTDARCQQLEHEQLAEENEERCLLVTESGRVAPSTAVASADVEEAVHPQDFLCTEETDFRSSSLTFEKSLALVAQAVGHATKGEAEQLPLAKALELPNKFLAEADTALAPEIEAERACRPERPPVVLMEEIITETEVIIESVSDEEAIDHDVSASVNVSKPERVPQDTVVKSCDSVETLPQSCRLSSPLKLGVDEQEDAAAVKHKYPLEDQPFTEPLPPWEQFANPIPAGNIPDTIVVQGTDDWEVQFKENPPNIVSDKDKEGLEEDEEGDSNEQSSSSSEQLSTTELQAMLFDAKKLIHDAHGRNDGTSDPSQVVNPRVKSPILSDSETESDFSKDSCEADEAAVAAALANIYSATDELKAMVETAKNFMAQVHASQATAEATSTATPLEKEDSDAENDGGVGAATAAAPLKRRKEKEDETVDSLHWRQNPELKFVDRLDVADTVEMSQAELADVAVELPSNSDESSAMDSTKPRQSVDLSEAKNETQPSAAEISKGDHGKAQRPNLDSGITQSQGDSSHCEVPLAEANIPSTLSNIAPLTAPRDSAAADSLPHQPAARPKVIEGKVECKTGRKRTRVLAQLPAMYSFEVAADDEDTITKPTQTGLTGSHGPVVADENAWSQLLSSPRPSRRRHSKPRKQASKPETRKTDQSSLLNVDHGLSRPTPSPPPPSKNGAAEDPKSATQEDEQPNEINISSESLTKASVQDWSAEEWYDDSLDEDKDGDDSKGAGHLSDDSLEDGRTSMPSLIGTGVRDTSSGSGLNPFPGPITPQWQDVRSHGPGSTLASSDITANLSQQEASVRQQFAVDKLLDVAANFSDDSIDNEVETFQRVETATACSQPECSPLAKCWDQDDPHPDVAAVQDKKADQDEKLEVFTGPGQPQTTVHTASSSKAAECLTDARSVTRRSSLKRADAGSIRNVIRKTVRFEEPEQDFSSGSDTDSLDGLEGECYTLHDPNYERTRVIYDPYAAEHTLMDEWEYEDDATQL